MVDSPGQNARKDVKGFYRFGLAVFLCGSSLLHILSFADVHQIIPHTYRRHLDVFSPWLVRERPKELGYVSLRIPPYECLQLAPADQTKACFHQLIFSSLVLCVVY